MGNALHPVHGPATGPKQRTDQRLRWVSAVIVSATAATLVSALLVGATGFEPVTSSVSGGSDQLATPRAAPGCSVLPQLKGGIA